MNLEVITRKPAKSSDHPPLLLIHGAWHGAWCWEWYQDYFAEHGYESHALSLRGHGASECPQHYNWTRIAAYVEDVAEVVKRFPDPPVLIGHSMGGFIIQKYLEQKKAPAAVLLATIPVHGIFPMFLRIGLKHPWQAVKCLARADTRALLETRDLAREALFSVDVPEETLDRCFAALQREAYAAGWDTLLFDLPKPDKVNIPPLLVLGGADDRLFHPDEIEKTARMYHTRAEIIPRMAHNMIVEQEWRKAAGRIVEWLNAKGF